MKNFVLRAVNRILRVFGLSIVSSQSLFLNYQHDYGPDGYEGYKRIQVTHNKRKIDQVWADEKTLRTIADYIRSHIDRINSGICHGTRRGYEQEKFSELLGCPVIGTEISDTAEQFANTVQWDFHDPKEEWRHGFSFVYSNSLDQAFDPEKALSTWADQLEKSGLMFIEHTMVDSAGGGSEMDPFGAHPMVMPYLLFKWGKGRYRMVDIIELQHTEKRNIWIYVIGKDIASGQVGS